MNKQNNVVDLTTVPNEIIIMAFNKVMDLDLDLSTKEIMSDEQHEFVLTVNPYYKEQISQIEHILFINAKNALSKAVYGCEPNVSEEDLFASCRDEFHKIQDKYNREIEKLNYQKERANKFYTAVFELMDKYIKSNGKFVVSRLNSEGEEINAFSSGDGKLYSIRTNNVSTLYDSIREKEEFDGFVRFACTKSFTNPYASVCDQTMQEENEQ